jgi:hypothetical protein
VPYTGRLAAGRVEDGNIAAWVDTGWVADRVCPQTVARLAASTIIGQIGWTGHAHIFGILEENGTPNAD